MAFIRQYSNRNLTASYVGDPGFGSFLKRAFKPPRALRKLQPGKVLGRVVSAVAPFASFIPGVGGLVARLGRLAAPVRALARRYGFPEDELASIVADRMGIDLDSYEGDPGPAPKPQKRRKQAASGGKAKAAKRRQVKGQRASRGAPAPKTSKSFKIPEGLGRELGELLGNVPYADIAQTIGRNIDPSVMGTAARASKMPRMPGAMFGRRRRSMNPANVKALRRGLRRVEGFQRLVKSVERAYPRMRAATRGGGGRRLKGHKSGCGCVSCRRAA